MSHAIGVVSGVVSCGKKIDKSGDQRSFRKKTGDGNDVVSLFEAGGRDGEERAEGGIDRKCHCFSGGCRIQEETAERGRKIREKIGNYVVIIVKNCYTKLYELNKNRQKIHQQLPFRLWSERKREYI